MEGILALLEWPSAATWGAFAFGTAFAIVAQGYRYVRHGFHQWRLDRRLARDPYILRAELNEYRLAIGEDLAPLNPLEVIMRSLLAGVVYAVPMWLIERQLDHWLSIAEATLFALVLLIGLWRWLNDPRDLRDREVAEEDSGDMPSEAGIGFVDAVIIICLLMLFGLFVITAF